MKTVTLEVTFCEMLENGNVIPIAFNESTTCLLYQPEGRPFSPNQWRQIAEMEARRLLDESRTGKKTVSEDEPAPPPDKV